MLTNSIKYTSVSLLFFLVFVSYYTTYAFWAQAEPSGPVGCERTGTVKVTCCQEHIINRNPTNPAGILVTYSTDCDIGSGGGKPSGSEGYKNCGERYLLMFEKDRQTLHLVNGYHLVSLSSPNH